MKKNDTSVKEKVKAKAKATKEKLKGKLKGRKSVAVLAVALLALAGCHFDTGTATPSRATTATFGNIGIRNEVSGGGTNIVVKSTISIGDVAFASADSEGSTETQSATATPTMDIKPDIDVEVPVNKSGGGALSAGSILGDAAASAVKGLMSKSSTSGTAAKVDCADGSCTTGECVDGSCTPQ